MDVLVFFPLFLSFLSSDVCGADDTRPTEGTAKVSPFAQPYIRRFQFHFLARPQREECFYQHGYEGTHLVMYYQVMDDGGTIRFREKSPSNEETYTELESRGHRTVEVKQEGDHQYCFINLKRSLMKIHVMLTVVDRNLQRKLYVESAEVPEEYQGAWNATIALLSDVDTMHSYLFQGRRRGYFDLQLVQQNGDFVRNWSLVQCCVIILAGALQVYALRTMFKTVSVTPTNKPRS